MDRTVLALWTPGVFFLRFSAGVLTGLNLAGNQIRDAEGAAAIAEALRGNEAVLTDLNLSPSRRGDGPRPGAVL